MNKSKANDILKHAGIELNGSRPQDIRVNNEKFYSRLLAQGSLGLGESYMDGWWDANALDQTFDKLLSAELDKKIKTLGMAFNVVRAKALNLQNVRRSRIVGEQHYDVGNDLYERMLDKRMTYTCGYWKDAPDLNSAQEAKLDLVCRKLGLKPGQKVLDIGCGWGSFAKFAAEKYDAIVTGVTISKEQAALAQKSCQGLSVEIKLEDYRNTQGKFDHVVSLGMIEHVGYKNYREYMQKVRDLLKDSGLFLLQTIGGNKSVHTSDPWILKYIFPNSMLPSIKQLAQSIEGLFVMEDWHNFSADYDRTLMAWYANFDAAWGSLKEKYGERFYRMWKYYLLCCAGTFRARKNQLWQVVLSPNGVRGGYQSPR